MKGKVIVFEGVDGVGKTTVAKALVERLKSEGHEASFFAQPSEGPIGRLIRENHSAGRSNLHPDDVSALLFAADRMLLFYRDITPRVERGEIVVCDRHVFSSFVYQAKDPQSEIGSDPDLLRFIGAINSRVPSVDATFWLNAPFATARSRIGERAGRLDSLEEWYAHKAHHARYENITAASFFSRHCGPVHALDATLPVDDLVGIAYGVVSKM
jgi:dTMP kinase